MQSIEKWFDVTAGPADVRANGRRELSYVDWIVAGCDQAEALVISDRIAVMNAGRIEQIGAPNELELYNSPNTSQNDPTTRPRTSAINPSESARSSSAATLVIPLIYLVNCKIAVHVHQTEVLPE